MSTLSARVRSGLFVVGGATNLDAAPRADVDAFVVRELVALLRLERGRRERVARRSDEGAVRRAEILDVPTVVVERELRRGGATPTPSAEQSMSGAMLRLFERRPTSA